jgi:hypothetical protein
MPGDGSLQAVLVAQPELPGAAIEQAGTKIYTSGASFLGRVATKAIYLPVWRKVLVGSEGVLAACRAQNCWSADADKLSANLPALRREMMRLKN